MWRPGGTSQLVRHEAYGEVARYPVVEWLHRGTPMTWIVAAQEKGFVDVTPRGFVVVLSALRTEAIPQGGGRWSWRVAPDPCSSGAAARLPTHLGLSGGASS